MKLTDAQMNLLVPAWERRLAQLDDAHLAEFKEAMEITFMPFVRRQLEIFDREQGFSSLPCFGARDDDESAQGEEVSCPCTVVRAPRLEDQESTQASSSPPPNVDLPPGQWPGPGWKDMSLPTSPLLSPLGELLVSGSSFEVQAANRSEGMIGQFFDDAMHGTCY